mgnify:CR=1 FL=1
MSDLQSVYDTLFDAKGNPYFKSFASSMGRGLAGIINPSSISQDIYSSTFILVLMVGLTLLMMRTFWRISRIEGFILVSINLIRWYYDLSA